MYSYIKKLKAKGVKVALLTNNGWWTPDKTKSVIMDDLSPFDVVVESCKEGIFKPDPKIFEVSDTTKTQLFTCDHTIHTTT